MIRLPIYIAGLLLACTATAEIHQWTDEKGNRHFGDRPPHDAAHETVRLRNIYPFRRVSTGELPEWAKRGGREMIIDTAEWCGICKQATRYLRDTGIAYREYDIDKSDRRRRDFTRLKARGVPIILVGDKRMYGFSSRRFQALYDG